MKFVEKSLFSFKFLIHNKMASKAQEELQRAKAIVGEYQKALGLDSGPDHEQARRTLGTHYSPEITWYGVEPFNVLTGMPCFNYLEQRNDQTRKIEYKFVESDMKLKVTAIRTRRGRRNLLETFAQRLREAATPR